MAELIGGALLFALACNLDTLILAITYGLKGLRLTVAAVLVLGAVTTAVTGVALSLGHLAADILAPLSGLLGGLTLAGLGLWTLLDALRQTSSDNEPSTPPALTPAACVPLGAALAVNNAGAGVAAGLSGLPVVWCAAANLLVTVLALLAGRALAARVRALPRLGKATLLLSGGLLLLLGVLQIWNG